MSGKQVRTSHASPYPFSCNAGQTIVHSRADRWCRRARTRSLHRNRAPCNSSHERERHSHRLRTRYRAEDLVPAGFGGAFAAQYAEAIFTAQQRLADAQEFYADIKARTARFGRDPDAIKVLPGIVPVIGSTEAEAEAKAAELESYIVHEFAHGQLADLLKVPIADLPLDEQLPSDLLPEDAIEGAKSRYTLIVDLARRENLTVRQLIGRLGGGRGHRTFTGTPDQVADALESWFVSGAADGFNIMPPVLPSGLDLFVDHVVPILQARGLFRTEYTADTLRGHYGLPRPENSNAVAGLKLA